MLTRGFVIVRVVRGKKEKKKFHSHSHFVNIQPERNLQHVQLIQLSFAVSCCYLSVLLLHHQRQIHSCINLY